MYHKILIQPTVFAILYTPNHLSHRASINSPHYLMCLIPFHTLLIVGMATKLVPEQDAAMHQFLMVLELWGSRTLLLVWCALHETQRIKNIIILAILNNDNCRISNSSKSNILKSKSSSFIAHSLAGFLILIDEEPKLGKELFSFCPGQRIFFSKHLFIFMTSSAFRQI